MSTNKAITKRSEDYSQWYLDIVEVAELAENSVVRGCMVIKPHGYAIWENFQKVLDKMIKDTGHKNVYFPLFIPKSLLSKEAEHVDGFAKESAVVTHHRLKAEDGKVVVDEEAKLEEELIVRPTSETIIYDTYSRWIQSWRDLPLLLNQWANVVRWEMRTRPFLRTAEFLWQEGHTAHATYEEADHEAKKMLRVYQAFAEEYLAMSVIPGQKSDSERFAGALHTYTIEAMMQDGKALQSGTSHNLGDNFAKAFDIKFADKDGALKYVWQTSWGLSTRMIGGLIMQHSDDKGLVLPPKIAPVKVIIVPIWKDDNSKDEIIKHAENIKELLSRKLGDVTQLSLGEVVIDTRDFLTVGEKFFEWEKKGIPVRIEIGARDIENNSVVAVRRDTSEKYIIKVVDLNSRVEEILENIQKSLFEKAKNFREDNSHRIDTYVEFRLQLEKEIPGFIYSHWCGSNECEAQIKEETKATTRCYPFDQKEERGNCIRCGKESNKRIIFAKAY
jgi:prolyl-tRNA synthetase